MNGYVLILDGTDVFLAATAEDLQKYLDRIGPQNPTGGASVIQFREGHRLYEADIGVIITRAKVVSVEEEEEHAEACRYFH